MLGALGSTANARAGGAQGKEAHPHVIGDVSWPVPAKARSAAPLALHVLDGVLDHQPISSGDPLVDMAHAGGGTGSHQHMVLVGDVSTPALAPPPLGAGAAAPAPTASWPLKKDRMLRLFVPFRHAPAPAALAPGPSPGDKVSPAERTDKSGVAAPPAGTARAAGQEPRALVIACTDAADSPHNTTRVGPEPEREPEAHSETARTMLAAAPAVGKGAPTAASRLPSKGATAALAPAVSESKFACLILVLHPGI